MHFLRIFKHRIKGLRALLLCLLAAATSALLGVAPAGAETAGAASAPPAVEIPDVAAQPESTSVPAPQSPAPEPVETQVTSVPASPGTSVPSPGPAGEDSSEAPTPSERPAPASNPPASTSAVDSVVKSVDSVVDRVAPNSSSIADSAGATVARIGGAPARVAQEAKAAPAPKHLLSELAGEISRNSSGMAALATDLLPAFPALQPGDLLNSLLPASATAVAPGGQSPAGGEPWAQGTMSFPKFPDAGSFSNRGAVAPAPRPGGYQGVAGKFATGGTPLSKSGGWDAARLQAASAAGPAGAAIDHVRRPAAPSDFPLPVPGSPASAVADSGGTSFVPIVALLALLALAAPATLRRIGKAPGFRAPNPFVCALERPG